MADTTSILDLPSNPSQGGNVSMSINENTPPSVPVPSVSSEQQSISLDSTTINQIINGLQQASASGATMLPSRDYPQVTNTITQDIEVQPNFIDIKSNARKDYISESETNEAIVKNVVKEKHLLNNLDEIYEIIQTPLLLIILYFIFQLPIINKYTRIYFPFFFSSDGNKNIHGILFTSVLFGFTYSMLNIWMNVLLIN